MIAALVSPLESVAPGLSFQVAFGLLTLVAIAFLQLNWLLSLAPVFVVRDAEDTFGSISAALTFVQDHLPEVLTISGIFGAMHLALLLFFGSLALPLLGAAASLSGPLLMLLIFLLTLTYLGLAIGLYLARLAAYISIAGAAPQALVLRRQFLPAPL
jgi:hypothetical protein